MQRDSSEARPVDPGDPPDAHDATGKFLSTSALLQGEVDAGGLDVIPGDWFLEDKAWIRAEVQRELERPSTPLSVRCHVRRCALRADRDRLFEELKRDDEAISRGRMDDELARIRKLLTRLTPKAWVRLAGVAMLRWSASGRDEAAHAVDLMALALGILRNTLDVSLGSIWSRLLDNCPFPAWRQAEYRPRLLWHLFEPALGDVEAAWRYAIVCEEGEDTPARLAHERLSQARRVNDKQQEIAGTGWTSLCLEIDEIVEAGSELERALLRWADRHLVAEFGPVPIAQRTLFQRLSCANRPAEDARAHLADILARAHPRVLAAFQHMDQAVRCADRMRAAWHETLDAYKRAREEISTGFIEKQNTFLRSLASAHERSVKGHHT